MAETYVNVRSPKGMVQFRTDPDFVPEKKEEVCAEFIKNYCLAHGEKEWLKSVLKDEEGKYLPIAKLRPKFWNKFFAPNRCIWDDLWDD